MLTLRVQTRALVRLAAVFDLLIHGTRSQDNARTRSPQNTQPSRLWPALDEIAAANHGSAGLTVPAPPVTLKQRRTM